MSFCTLNLVTPNEKHLVHIAKNKRSDSFVIYGIEKCRRLDGKCGPLWGQFMSPFHNLVKDENKVPLLKRVSLLFLRTLIIGSDCLFS